MADPTWGEVIARAGTELDALEAATKRITEAVGTLVGNQVGVFMALYQRDRPGGGFLCYGVDADDAVRGELIDHIEKLIAALRAQQPQEERVKDLPAKCFCGRPLTWNAVDVKPGGDAAAPSIVWYEADCSCGFSITRYPEL